MATKAKPIRISAKFTMEKQKICWIESVGSRSPRSTSLGLNFPIRAWLLSSKSQLVLLHNIASRRHCLYFVYTQNIIVIVPKYGSKQSNIHKNKQRKKKGFRGVQKQTVLKAKTRDQTATVAVAFVGEEDVVSERIPPPKTPASSRKLGAQEQEWSDSESYEFEEKVKRLSACFCGQFVEVCSWDSLTWTMCFRCVIWYF